MCREKWPPTFSVDLIDIGVVAPYEADAQLAYLSKIGYIDGVVTEDTDLLVFGAQTVLLKLSPDAIFDRIRLRDLGSVDYYSSRTGFVHLIGGHMNSLFNFAFFAAVIIYQICPK